MSRDYEFFDGVPPHVGTDTSLDAAKSIRGDASRLRSIVLRAIRARGPQGATCDEIETELNMRHQTASARIRELVLAGHVVDSQQQRKTRSNRNAVVYLALINPITSGGSPTVDPGMSARIDLVPPRRFVCRACHRAHSTWSPRCAGCLSLEGLVLADDAAPKPTSVIRALSAEDIEALKWLADELRSRLRIEREERVLVVLDRLIRKDER
jgi:hypothetical protein